MKAPDGLTREQRNAFRRIARHLEARGIDPETRRELLADYVLLEARIAALRIAEGEGSGIATTRAINTATAERRRLYGALFAGARRIEPAQPAAAVAPAAALDRRAAADAAWRECLHGGCLDSMTREAGRARMAEIEAQHGLPSWGALMYATPEAEVEAERIIARATRHGNSRT